MPVPHSSTSNFAGVPKPHRVLLQHHIRHIRRCYAVPIMLALLLPLGSAVKRTGLIIALALLAGCAAHQPMNAARSTPRAPTLDELAQPASASSALVFDPPVTLGMPQLDLSRDQRQPQAFWGYDEGSTTAYYIRTEDRQIDDSFDGIHRQAISERFGVSRQ